MLVPVKTMTLSRSVSWEKVGWNCDILVISYCALFGDFRYSTQFKLQIDCIDMLEIPII